MDEFPLVRVVPAQTSAPALAILGEADLLAAFLAGRKPTTLRAYRKDLGDFAAFLGAPDARSAVELLVSGSAGQANALALGYRAHLTDRALSPATIARRLAALRSVVKLARTLGRVAWAIDISSPKAEAYRDTRGPGLDGWRRMLAAARERATTPKGKRDLALVRLMHDLGLRRGEAVALDLADVDLEQRTLAVIGKGRDEKIPLTLNAPTAAALVDWIASRGDWPGPLFVRLDRAAGPGLPGRLDTSNAARVAHSLGRRAGVARGTNPHGLRHQGITRALDLAGGDVRRVRRFSRHAKLETLLRYDDNRRDEAGAIAHLLGEDSA
ncbi:MAG: tyrosine-type recombinase/integrase [Isosphaeraceae bacterium]|nr:tyrosine-type recombinase/integrase [Isosphaeraceae bacterium]